MENFHKTHKYLVEHVTSPVRRLLMDEIDWTHRMIGIKGSRGVGKTTFLLQYAKEHFGANNRACLYVNFNNLYFTTNSLVDFAGEFCKQGGKTLLLDQIFKYENWSKELRTCYDKYPNLQIIFSGSSVMRLVEDNEYLKDIVAVYNLQGFSFREYLNLKSGNNFSTYKLEEILQNPIELSEKIRNIVNPLDYFTDYLHHGYYPFFLESRNYSENLLKTINMMMEVDILLIKQIDLKYLPKIRKLLNLIMQCAPCALNISQLSDEIQTSRSTIMNYLKYLRDARLLNLQYKAGEDFPKKPRAVFPQNTNIMHVLTDEVKKDDEMKTFLYNALHAKHKVSQGKKHNDFLIDNKIDITYLSNIENKKTRSHNIYAMDDVRLGQKNEIPVWLFGFLH
ncbi:MAG TPA: AAA family ATPase [Bacteroidales bacterium]|nr:AAA family ATPase [Bacteroidales bacterium]